MSVVFLTQVSVHKTDANLGHRASWAEVPRERGARSGVNKKQLWRHGWKPRPPQKQPSFRSAWTGQRPVPTQPLETRPYKGKLAGEANVRTWTGVLLRQETGRNPSRFSRWCSLVTSKVSVSS